MNASFIQPVFNQNPIDRSDHLRGNVEQWRRITANHAQQRYLLFSSNQILLNGSTRDYLFSAAQLSQQIFEQQEAVFLGVMDHCHYFALELSDTQVNDYVAIPLRAFVLENMADEALLGLFAEANSLLNWHKTHGFCARCGHKSENVYGGWRRDCKSCSAQHFPRTDPVVIMLVTDSDKCLLGRGHNFGEKRYSCLAGFMEPGETIAQAARRELFEEAGIIGGEVTFLFEQPWPFPSSLMMGVHVEAESTQINIDENELADAIWVTKDEVKAALNGVGNDKFDLPLKIAIARNLLEHFVR